MRLTTAGKNSWEELCDEGARAQIPGLKTNTTLGTMKNDKARQENWKNGLLMMGRR
jgi:hypothetical protein